MSWTVKKEVGRVELILGPGQDNVLDSKKPVDRVDQIQKT
jgi:hypothetical protein